MKIAFVGQNIFPAQEGTQKYVEQVSLCMAKMGHNVTIYCAEKFSQKNSEKITCKFCKNYFNNRFGNFLNVALSFVDMLFEKYDVVHFQSQKLFFLGKIIAKIKPQTKVVASFDLFCDFKSKPNVSIKVSKDLDEITKYKLRSKRYALMVCNLNKESGAHYAIEAFKSLEDTASTPNNFKLVLLEAGESDEQYLNYLRTITEGRANIVLINSRASRLCKQLYSHAYLFIESSEKSHKQDSLVAAMSYGIAPVVSNIKENTEIVGESGCVFEAKSIGSLREKLAFLLSQNNEVEKLGQLAKIKIESEHSWEAIARKVLQFK